ncbi:hypothetical protein J5N97_003232 [Dioscorea zingiberensis]|uniref:Uncharacterized protein n=1 Tax=Dioscorea zingiberensis TaxID=325984 RepID=A0A9D5D3U5_9LILI|nr:hypothetical protein J5N97_003232 [Dioscorea zingiberensis]
MGGGSRDSFHCISGSLVDVALVQRPPWPPLPPPPHSLMLRARLLRPPPTVATPSPTSSPWAVAPGTLSIASVAPPSTSPRAGF